MFGELRERYLNRPGGYTRVLRTEPRNKYDQAPSAILEFVDGPRDMRFMITAKAVAEAQKNDRPLHSMTIQNMNKVTRYRQDGQAAFQSMVERFKGMGIKSTKSKASVAEPAAPVKEGSA